MFTFMSPTLKMWSIIVMVSNVNLVKFHDCSDSNVLTYALVKYYSFGGSIIRPYAHTFVRLYEGLFQHELIYFLIIYMSIS